MRLSVWTVAQGLIFIVGLILITMQFFYQGVDYPIERYTEDMRHLSWLFVLISCYSAIDQLRDDVNGVRSKVKDVRKELREFAESFEEQDDEDLDEEEPTGNLETGLREFWEDKREEPA